MDDDYINMKIFREAIKFLVKNLRDFKRRGLIATIKFGKGTKISLRRRQPCIQETA